MDFPNATRAILNGKFVKRIEWNNGDYCLLQDTWLKIYKEKDQKFHEWLVSEGDMVATDWVVVPEGALQ